MKDMEFKEWCKNIKELKQKFINENPEGMFDEDGQTIEENPYFQTYCDAKYKIAKLMDSEDDYRLPNIMEPKDSLIVLREIRDNLKLTFTQSALTKVEKLINFIENNW